MEDISRARAQWTGMQAEWQVINQEARTARHLITRAFAECMAGKGTGPTEGQLDLADKLERAADEKRLAMDEFLRKVFN